MHVPHALRLRYLAKSHEAHQGVGKTRARTRQYIYLPGLSVDIERYLSQCNVCIKFSPLQHEPTIEFPLPDGPWEELACDLFEFLGRHYLVVVYYSRWIEAIPLSAQTSRAVIAA